MFDRNKVIVGVVIFLAMITIPLWHNLGKTVAAPAPKLDTPAIQKLAEKDKKCVMPKEWMRANHMQMLVDWRDNVVRTKEQNVTTSRGREFVAPDGKQYLASLTNTCMECHSNKAQFCDQCHNYVAVAPNCWGCHLETGKKLVEAK
ncbi:MAG: menaquinol oxidoreductase [Desulfobacca sp. RBG_16_60_12]|nr:MAG: menaquinol oxidoreductase [Desulfobacca sp. RBG_16_60_12]